MASTTQHKIAMIDRLIAYEQGNASLNDAEFEDIIDTMADIREDYQSQLEKEKTT